MPVVGRIFNMTSEIFEITDRGLKQTFFISPQPDNNHCFYGECKRYCDVFHPVCGKKDLLEVIQSIVFIFLTMLSNSNEYLIN